MTRPRYDHNGGILDLLRANLSEDWGMVTKTSFGLASFWISEGHFGMITSLPDPAETGDDPELRNQSNRVHFTRVNRAVREDDLLSLLLVGHVGVGLSGPPRREHSLFVWTNEVHGSLTREHLTKYAKLHDRPAYLFSGPDHEVHVFDTTTGISQMYLGQFDPAKTMEYHSGLVRVSEDLSGQSRGSVESHDLIWEFVAGRNIASMLIRDHGSKRAAEELGVDLTDAKSRVEEKLGTPFHMFEDHYEVEA